MRTHDAERQKKILSSTADTHASAKTTVTQRYVLCENSSTTKDATGPVRLDGRNCDNAGQSGEGGTNNRIF
jgi:hypothetical protein